jgi:hypothetical protein
MDISLVYYLTAEKVAGLAFSAVLSLSPSPSFARSSSRIAVSSGVTFSLLSVAALSVGGFAG